MRHFYRLIILSFILIPQAHSETVARARYVGALSLRETPVPTIEIAWEMRGSGFTQIEVQRKAASEQSIFTRMGYLPAAQTRFSDTSNLEVGAGYFYRIRTCTAINRLGNCVNPGSFRWSKKIVLRELEPFAPGGLIGEVEYRGASTSLSVNLSWNDYNNLSFISFRNGNASNERGFVIERRLSSEPVSAYTRITSTPLPPDTTSFIDNTSQRGQEYVYRVGALNKSNQLVFPEGIHEYKQKVEEFYLSKNYLCGRLAAGQSLPAYVVDFNSYRLPTDRIGDDYEASSRAAADFSNRLDQARILIYPPGNYLINRYEDTRPSSTTPANHLGQNIRFRNSSKFRILGCNAVVSVKGSFERISDQVQSGESTDVCGLTHPSYVETRKTDALQGFRFENIDDLTVEGFEINGQSNRVRASRAMPESGSMGIFTENVRNSTFKDLYIHHFIGDGIYLGQGQNQTAFLAGGDPNLRIADRDIRIHNVRSYHNRRQGMTVVQARGVWVSNSRFNFTGLTGSRTHGGHSPMAGIDVEPNFFTMSKNDPGRTADEQYSYPGNKVDVTTGDILIENTELKNNLGASFASSLGRKIRVCPDRTIVGTMWPVARIENMKLRFSSLVAPSEVPAGLVTEDTPGTVGLAVKEGSLENSYVDVGDSRIRVSAHTGTALKANKNDALISVKILNNVIRSSGLAIDGGNGRHPLSVVGNIMVGVHQSFPTFSADGAEGAPRVLNFIRVFRNQVARRDTSLDFELPIGGPNSNLSLRANRNLLLDPNGVREFKNNTIILPSVLYQAGGPLAQSIAIMASTLSTGNRFMTPSLTGPVGAHFVVDGIANPQSEYFDNCSIRPTAGYAQCREEGYLYPQ